jgi:hypothetical protein
MTIGNHDNDDNNDNDNNDNGGNHDNDDNNDNDDNDLNHDNDDINDDIPAFSNCISVTITVVPADPSCLNITPKLDIRGSIVIPLPVYIYKYI